VPRLGLLSFELFGPLLLSPLSVASQVVSCLIHTYPGSTVVGIWNREENQVKTAKPDHERRSKHTYSARIYAGKACVFR
jgi:hypothetical protein